MSELERLADMDAIRQLKARYFRCVDTADASLAERIFAKDCVLDYIGCCTDPRSGRDFLPEMNVVLRGRDAFSAEGLAGIGIVSVHQGHNAEIEITGATTARAVWSMTDRLYRPPGAPFSLLLGFGHYHETYEKTDGAWLVKTLKLTRLRVEVS